MRLTTKPGHSAARIGIFLICCANVVAAWVVSGDVSSPSITSISRMTEAGPKKWKPTTLCGRCVASAISVIERPDVLEASTAWPGVTASSSANTWCLMAIFSGTASITKSTSPNPSYSVAPLMLPRIRWIWASPCSCVSLPLPTSFAAWLCVTSRALSSPASTNRRSTSLRMTGMSAAAMTCAISPPMTPAPTTAALNTNMAMTLAAGHGLQLHIPAALAGEAVERPAQRRDDRTAHEQEVHQTRDRGALLDLVVQRERDRRMVRAGGERDPLGPAHAAVLDGERLARPRLEGLDALDHAL